MTVKKLAVFFICVIIACCSCLGCGNDKPENNGTRVVKDAKGYEVQVPAHPMRIVSFSISCDEILLGLVEPERIASVSYLCDDAGISHVVEKSKAVKERIKGTPSVERIMALKPDLVILGDWWTPDSIQTIRDMGISVYVYKTPYTVADIKKAIREIADVVDAKQQGEAVIKEYDAKIAKAQAVIKAANIKQQKKIVVMSGHGVIGTKGSLFADICKYAQVDNCMEQLQTGQNTTVSKEFIVQSNPDVIIMPGWNGAPTHTLETEKELLNDQSLQSVKAIQNKNLVTLSGQDMYCTSQYVADSILAIDKLVYPEYFK